MTIHPAKPRRRARLALVAGATVLIFTLFSGGSYTAYGYWSSPTFCHSCHIMDPYYESWENSSHAEVACVDCHFEPGIQNELRGKWVAVKQLAAWATGAYSSMPYAEVSDASCMTSECHSVEELSQPVAFSDKHVAFDHSTHLGELRRGIALACTSCHATRSRDTHMELDRAACFLCHFKGADAEGVSIGACDTCHGPPEGVTSVAGFTVDHEDYRARGMACDQCHAELSTGTGRVGAERCYSCHNEPEKIAKLGEVGLLHVEHVTVRKKHCYQCHDLIDHGNGGQHAASGGDCQSCHDSGHLAQAVLLAGEGAVGVESIPSPKHHLGVDCAGCHGGMGPAHQPGSASCAACHGDLYDAYAEESGSALDEMLTHLEGRVGSVRRAAEAQRSAGDLLDRETYRSMVAAEGNLQHLRDAGPVHNPLYAVEVLRAGLVSTEELEEALGIEPDDDYPLGFEVEDCGICHDGLPEPGALVLDGERAFPHPVHVEETGMDCSDCHVGDKHPPRAPTSASTCSSCHQK